MTEVITQLKNVYREHLFTAEGKKHIKEAIELKQIWNATIADKNIQFNTAGVKQKLLPNVLKGKTTCIEITPIGLNNHCHYTSELFEKKCEGVKRVLGFNITACPCGRIMSLEIHSVNKIGDKLYDFTRDFNDETSKYFAEIDTKLTARQHNRIFSANPITINKGCKCPIRWASALKYLMDDEELEDRIETMEKMEVEETPFGYIFTNFKN